jgi:hypothetical protein
MNWEGCGMAFQFEVHPWLAFGGIEESHEKYCNENNVPDRKQGC